MVVDRKKGEQLRARVDQAQQVLLSGSEPKLGEARQAAARRVGAGPVGTVLWTANIIAAGRGCDILTGVYPFPVDQCRIRVWTRVGGTTAGV